MSFWENGQKMVIVREAVEPIRNLAARVVVIGAVLLYCSAWDVFIGLFLALFD